MASSGFRGDLRCVRGYFSERQDAAVHRSHGRKLTGVGRCPPFSFQSHLPLASGQCVQEGHQVGLLPVGEAERAHERPLVGMLPAAWGTIFIIDPLYTVPLLMGVLAALIIRRDRRLAYRANTLGRVVVMDGDGYLEGFYSLLDKSPSIRFRRYRKPPGPVLA